MIGRRQNCSFTCQENIKNLSQPFYVAGFFTGFQRKCAKTEDTIRGFAMVLEGKIDNILANNSNMKGIIEEEIQESEK
jgi:F-type H+-transporting ATPase subunit beta